MIQEAQIGIGISGREGRQAVNSSDFAIAQFRFLKRLLFVHGRTNYVRNCTLISFTLFKSYVLTSLMFLYIFFTDFTAENIFNAMVQSSYNIILSIPVWLLGTFNRDVSERTLEEHRFLYGTGRRKENLNLRVVVELALQGLSDILAIFFLPYFCFNYDVLGSSGTTVGHVTWGTMVYTYFIVAMLVRTVTLTCTWTVWNFAGLGIALLLELAFLLIYQSSVDLSWDFYGVSTTMTQSSPFWLLAFLVPLICWYVDATLKALRVEMNPSLTDIGQALDRGEKVNLEKYSALVANNETTESALQMAVEEANGDSSVQVSSAGSGNSTNFDHSASERSNMSSRGLLGTLRRVIFPGSGGSQSGGVS
jgi:magnesium-transporting ATPase (P-type)